MLNTFEVILLLIIAIPAIQSQIHVLGPQLPSIGNNVCRVRPLGCEISCPFGYKVGFGGNCLCACVDDPCQLIECRPDEVCRRNYNGTAQCVSQLVSQGLREPFWKTGDCPLLLQGSCTLICSTDSDCFGEQKCCSNGCGRECVAPVTSPPQILNAIPIKPIVPGAPVVTTVSSSRVGFCPPKSNIQNTNCESICQQDGDCPGVEKCCDNGCATVCAPPDKATHCVHLLSSVSRLPKKVLANGYIPKCAVDGLFEKIQCDRVYCWCVDAVQGWEIPGTKVFKENGPPNCEAPKICPNVVCLNPCPHGLKTQQDGCPISNCECKNLCDDITCEINSEACQLVEPDCGQPPCIPVPRCLLSPCPRGLPMTLPNGVTALCTRSSQCSRNFWCHQVGYNGLGFCCSSPESAIREGHCAARIPRHSESCESECRSDPECQIGSKCCFDGCGLKCIPNGFPPNPFQAKSSKNKAAQEHNKEVLSSLLAECPENHPQADNAKCDIQCQKDSDCFGMKRCCSVGCSSICAYPAKTTACMHEAITAEVYKNGRYPKCDPAGNYEQHQCDSEGCYCVDVNTGSMIPFTRVPLDITPICDEVTRACEADIHCAKDCPFGFEVGEDGCKKCECKSLCSMVNCPQDQICVLSNVECFQKHYCPPQPRCVPNICPIGRPFSFFDGSAELCSSSVECPDGYWCNSVGLNKKGFCCSNPRKEVGSGLCPATPITLDISFSDDVCKLLCKSDEECAVGSKCCFNGCGTHCVVTEVASSQPVRIENNKPVQVSAKNWQCSTIDTRTNCTDGIRDFCTSDAQCPGMQKCCSFGCGRACMYPQKATGCLHLKAALEKISSPTTVNCKEDGAFGPVQCDQEFCWCSSAEGKEIEGTRVSGKHTPNCHNRRVCPQPKCALDISCPYGKERDISGCDTCKCYNPCKNVMCPGKKEICVPHPVECTTMPCLPVPRCIVNACVKGLPAIDEVTFEPLFCRETSQCKFLGSPAYCRAYKSNGGYCCWGNEDGVHLGNCPRVSENSAVDCSANCNVDNDCLPSEKCCHNGCGLSCLPAEQRAPIRSKTNKIGECPKPSEIELTDCRNSGEDVCTTDEDCPNIQKCCSNGCYKKCSYSHVTTACLHAQAAAEKFKKPAFTPQCDLDGEFVQIQVNGDLRFCVDSFGREVQGTRWIHRTPNCNLPKSCPVNSCTLHCPLGFRKDKDGCNQCACFDPCEDVRCPQFHICRLVQGECYTKSCSSFPKCIVNACPRGEPLVSLDTQQLAICTADGLRKCPTGYFCHQIGLALKNTGYCCAGNEPNPPEECSAVYEVVEQDAKNCTVRCRSHTDCGHGICCFNGCGTACKPLAAEIPDISEPVAPISQIVTEPKERLGVCAANPMSNPGCRSDCTKDGECPQFQKCCPYGCGRLCQFPRVATACIHRLAFLGNEVLRTANETYPQCNADGSFKVLQCNYDAKICWCVNTQTGVEIPGTRLPSFGPPPNCFAPKVCAVSCGNKCVYGVRLDDVGCPVNGICECRNPCEDLKCLRFDDVCVLKAVACLAPPCPPVPVCKANPCVGGGVAFKDRYGNSIPCTRDEECGKEQCRYVLGEQRLGVCCPLKTGQSQVILTNKVGECPIHTPNGVFASQNCSRQCDVDSDCEDVDKCCEYGCSKVCTAPLQTTNCIHLRAAISKLRKINAAVSLTMPQCDPVSGMFNAVQCDNADACWCADTVTGNEFYGTKTKLFNTAFNVCAGKNVCPISCDERGMVCPFGLDTDSAGCALTADCRCRNPCASVQCPAGFVCLLRPKECSDQTCVPVPTCEKNWCVNGQRPAVEPRTYTQFTCLENRTQICPSGFYCIGYDHTRRGICCPGQEPISSSGMLDTCPHGDAFSNSPDGSPLKCSVNTNGCPSTHYCLSKPTESTGICCVTKRYVCNLHVDAGPCTVSVPRFYYSAENQTCLPFSYGGCSGNLNNFGSKNECERFCVGTGVDPLLDFINDDGGVVLEVYQLGFSLVGPLSRKKHQKDFQSVFVEYLKKKFNIDDEEIKDLSIHDDNTVRFSLHSPDAKTKASNISSAVADGSFEFRYKGDTYRAEPHSWFSHQIAQEANAAPPGVFWTLVAASIVFGIVIFAALIFACFFLYRHGKTSSGNSSFRGMSPSNYVANTGYASSPTESPVCDSNDQQRLSQRLQVFTTDDMDQVKRVRRLDSGWQESPGSHTQDGRRPTRTTLYY